MNYHGYSNKNGWELYLINNAMVGDVLIFTPGSSQINPIPLAPNLYILNGYDIAIGSHDWQEIFTMTDSNQHDGISYQ